MALFNTFNRVSESVESIARFRNIYMDTLASSPAEQGDKQRQQQSHNNNNNKNNHVGSAPRTRSVIQNVSKVKKPSTQPSVSSSAGKDISQNHRGSDGEETRSLSGAASVRETLLELSRQPLGSLLWGGQHNSHRQAVQE